MHLQPVRPREGRDSRPVRKVAESEISKWWTIAVQHDNPDGQKLFPWHVLRLPQIKREHIGDAVHPKSDGTECVLARGHDERPGETGVARARAAGGGGGSPA